MRKAPLLGLVLWAVGCASGTLPIPAGWTAPSSSSFSMALDDAAFCQRVQCRHREAADVRLVTTPSGAKLVRGERDLTPIFVAIDSFDVSLERKEVIFSAKRKDNFDIGLVSIDGSDIHWVPEDAADETMVEWAPPGQKAIYRVATPAGDVVRAVHIPTATQLTTDFPWAHVRAMAWDPSSQRVSVVTTSVDASDRIESMRYGGEERRVDVPSTNRVERLTTEPFTGGVMLRPKVMRYGDRYPLVVWIGDPNAWDDRRWPLLRDGGVAVAVVRRAPDAAFWEAVMAAKFVDPDRVWVVGAIASPPSAVAGPMKITYIAPSETIPAGRYRMEGRVLLAPPAGVQSMAAGFISDQLKGTTPRNASHR